jgi:hypothetical protein
MPIICAQAAQTKVVRFRTFKRPAPAASFAAAGFGRISLALRPSPGATKEHHVGAGPSSVDIPPCLIQTTGYNPVSSGNPREPQSKEEKKAANKRGIFQLAIH